MPERKSERERIESLLESHRDAEDPAAAAGEDLYAEYLEARGEAQVVPALDELHDLVAEVDDGIVNLGDGPTAAVAAAQDRAEADFEGPS